MSPSPPSERARYRGTPVNEALESLGGVLRYDFEQCPFFSRAHDRRDRGGGAYRVWPQSFVARRSQGPPNVAEIPRHSD